MVLWCAWDNYLLRHQWKISKIHDVLKVDKSVKSLTVSTLSAWRLSSAADLFPMVERHLFQDFTILNNEKSWLKFMLKVEDKNKKNFITILQ